MFWEVNIHKSQLPMHLLLKLWGQGRHLNKMQTINWGNADFFHCSVEFYLFYIWDLMTSMTEVRFICI